MNDHRFDLIGYPPPYGLLVANKTSCPDIALEMRPEAWPPSQSQAAPVAIGCPAFAHQSVDMHVQCAYQRPLWQTILNL